MPAFIESVSAQTCEQFFSKMRRMGFEVSESQDGNQLIVDPVNQMFQAEVYEMDDGDVVCEIIFQHHDAPVIKTKPEYLYDVVIDTIRQEILVEILKKTIVESQNILSGDVEVDEGNRRLLLEFDDNEIVTITVDEKLEFKYLGRGVNRSRLDLTDVLEFIGIN